MKKFLTLSLCIAALACLARPREIAAREQTTSNRLDGRAIDDFVTRQMQHRRIPGAAVAVVQESQVIFERAYGVANLETGTPLTIGGVFEVASITKPFTATAIMLLVEDGRIRLDDSIAKYMPEAPESWRTRTIRQTLSHTAGFPLDGIVRWDGSPLLTVSTKQAFDFIAHAPLLFDAAEDGAYSDAGYFLLGMVIERASGQKYAEFLDERIFRPLKMANTSVMDRLKILKGRVPVYGMSEGELVNWGRDGRYELPSFFGVMSTLDDLARWEIAMRQGRLLKPSSLEEMWKPAMLRNGQEARVSGQPYGLGWTLGDNRGHRVAAHEGASGTLIVHLIDDDLTIIVLTNLGNPSTNNVGYIARGIAGLVRDDLKPGPMMTPIPDPDATRTAALLNAVQTLVAGRTSPIFLPGADAALSGLPPRARTAVTAQLSELQTLTYLGSDRSQGTLFRRGSRIADTLYYRSEGAGQTFYFLFWVTQEGRALTRIGPHRMTTS